MRVPSMRCRPLTGQLLDGPIDMEKWDLCLPYFSHKVRHLDTKQKILYECLYDRGVIIPVNHLQCLLKCRSVVIDLVEVEQLCILLK